MKQSESRNSTRISFVRHGRVHNPKKIIYGRLPRFRLSEEGITEARAAGDRLRRETISALFSSPMLRARQTAKEILVHHNALRLGISRLIIEVCSPFQGKPSVEADKVNWNLYEGASCVFEQPADIVRRVRRFIDRNRKRFPGRHVVAVTHGDVIAFTLLWAKGIKLHADHRLDMREHDFPDRYPATGSVATLSFKHADNAHPECIDYWRPGR